MRILALVLFLVVAGLSPAMSATLTPTHSTGSCTNASSEMLAENLGRTAALIINDGATDIWIKIGATAVANEGILIVPNGSYFLAWDAANANTDAINCISGGTIVVLVTEWAR